MLAETTEEHQKQREEHRTYCPSCGRVVDFRLIGEQRWPPEIAAAAGLPENMRLWLCSHCHSTISEIDIMF